MTLSVAVASRIDKVLSYSCDDLKQGEGKIPVGALVNAPLGRNQVTGLVVGQNSELPDNIDQSKLRSIKQLLPEDVWLTEELVDLINWCSRYYHISIGKILSTVLPKSILERNLRSITPPSIWQPLHTHLGEDKLLTLKRAPRQYALYCWIKKTEFCTSSDIKDAGFSLTLLKQLQNKGLIIENERKPNTAEAHNCSPPEAIEVIEEPHELNSEQSDALAKIQTSDAKTPLLLNGVTGSGKTEVYLQAAKSALCMGQKVLMLVPEIGLIPQIKERFSHRFNAEIHIYSSECSETEKLQSWCAAKPHKPAVFIGTRSAVFLPFEKLGLIIVDEEHDLSYKQQEGWRYHARNLATLRSRALKAPLVLGSATPSLESFHNTEVGAYKHIVISKRAAGTALPRIRLVSKQADQKLSLSEESLGHIQDTLKNDAQILVFINRRGFAPRLSCAHCGWIALCPECDKAMCMHMTPSQLICHHCDYRVANPAQCPACQSSQLMTHGAGTEQLTKHLKNWFPKVECLRIDRDSTSRKGSFEQYMNKAKLGDPCILVGTQMLAKGHHLPKLSLAVICEADQALFSHDYRAKEHLAQLVIQVAGRTGRKGDQGELLIETAFPDHPFWEQLLDSSYTDYAKQLLAERQKNALPPYHYSACLRADSKDLRLLLEFMDTAKQCISSNQPDIQVLGPLPAAIEKKRGRFRYYLSFNSARRKILHENLSLVSQRLESLKGFTQIRFNIDVDPQTLD